MAKPKRGYETIQYQPPTPQVFGNALPTDLPAASTAGPSSFNVDRPKHRPKLADRLAVYEDDNPRCQQIICVLGIIFPPLWVIGACIYIRTPTTKILTREVGFRNFLLACIFMMAVAAWMVYHALQARTATALSP
eukprot:CAMPEP_0194755148 /NCGR_PEP_ID=MMETSP0323_2-20130528/9040_1 /TAXON_ID=2866 ORGANISM="Crypthecodinium cohnii, Strain Seligo" /NCGR_SAMPLE_ID=MMETSP0323_2 /ASSEMBLY_ACC=CAM_ASM_000346 /LENGTH=134 /DNA_ID=CAMNT_0039674045 /DNA_START=22 /DNA_END=426 /DNA_ORIENTATION=+